MLSKTGKGVIHDRLKYQSNFLSRRCDGIDLLRVVHTINYALYE